MAGLLMGRKRLVRRAIILACTLALTAATALANDGEVGTVGGTMMLLDDSDVRMESELIRITCLARYAVYRCDFNFVNEGPARSVLMGFPFPSPGGDDRGPRPAAVRAWQDGRPLAVSRESGLDGELPVELFLHEVEMPTGSTTVTVHYLAGPGSGLASHPEDGPMIPGHEEFSMVGIGAYPYQVHTGAGWKGPIGEAIIRYELAEEFEGEWVEGLMRESSRPPEDPNDWTLPPYSQPDSSTFEWVYRDFEPTRDHNVSLLYVRPMDPKGLWVSDSSSVYGPGEAAGWELWSAMNGLPGYGWAFPADEVSWVEVPFSREAEIAEIRILPGADSGHQESRANGRPKTLRIEFSDDTQTVIELRDEPAMQVFPISVRATFARVTILDVYPGEDAGSPVYLSGIEFSEFRSPADIWEPFGETSEVPFEVESVEGPSNESVGGTGGVTEDVADSSDIARMLIVLGGVGLFAVAGVAVVVRRRPAGLLPARSAAKTLILSGPQGGYALPLGLTTLGSGSDNDIVLQAEGVSVLHAVIERTEAEVRLRATSQSSPTSVNGRQIGDVELAEGDVVAFGLAEFRVAVDRS